MLLISGTDEGTVKVYKLSSKGPSKIKNDCVLEENGDVIGRCDLFDEDQSGVSLNEILVLREHATHDGILAACSGGEERFLLCRNSGQLQLYNISGRLHWTQYIKFSRNHQESERIIALHLGRIANLSLVFAVSDKGMLYILPKSDEDPTIKAQESDVIVANLSQSNLCCATFDPIGCFLATCGHNSGICIWDLSKFLLESEKDVSPIVKIKLEIPANAKNHRITDIKWIDDGTSDTHELIQARKITCGILISTNNGWLYHYNKDDFKKPVLKIKAWNNPIKKLTVHHSVPKICFFSDNSGAIVRYDLEAGKVMCLHKGACGAVNNLLLVFCDDASRQFLVSTSYDYYIRVHNPDPPRNVLIKNYNNMHINTLIAV